ncbi:hypothetical protein C8R46DRAFT_1205612 [Mycena filopes]|nr:hypothetical protein C8R46DRAFT_1205612 [Mycena filopes]
MLLKLRLPNGREEPLEVDALNLSEVQTVRSGQTFSSWEAVSGTAFDIATAVITANIDKLCPPRCPPLGLTSGTLSAAHADSTQPETAPNPPIVFDVPRSAPVAPPIYVPGFSIINEHAASTGWIGLRDEGVSKVEEAAGVSDTGATPTHKLGDFFGNAAKFTGFRIAKYSGPATRPVIDDDGRVIAVYAGHEDNPNFMKEVHDPAVEAMEAARASASISEQRTYHRRGNFGALNAGQSHGGGQVTPGTLLNGVINTARLVLDTYFKLERADEEIERLNIEIRRLVTHIHDEKKFLDEQVAAELDLTLAFFIRRYQWRRARFDAGHMKRLVGLRKTLGLRFTGTLVPGKRLHTAVGDDLNDAEDMEWEDDFLSDAEDEGGSENEDDEEGEELAEMMETVLSLATDGVELPRPEE